MKTALISSGILIFPATLLVFFQFFTIVASALYVPFALSVLLGLAVAIVLAHVITTAFSKKFTCSYTDVALATSISAVMSLIVALRLNFTIADFVCPTGILGLITQITEGNLPVSYQSFPEFPMNYHQGFLLLTGLLSKLFAIPVAAATKIIFVSIYFLLNMGVMLFLLQQKNRYFYLPPLLFLFIASASQVLYTFLEAQAQPKISVLEFTTGNSWPLALLLLTAFLFIAKEYRHSRKHIVYVALLLLTLSTINAIVFQILLLGIGIFYAGYLLYTFYKDKKFQTENLVLIYTLALLVFFIPKIIPSAFMVGIVYGSPEIALRFFSPDTGSYIGDIKSYLLLMNILPLFTLILGIITLKRRDYLRIFLLVLLSISLVFPAVFIFTNIIDWDMTYKFSLFSMFLSAILITMILEQDKQYTRLIFLAIGISVVISSQTTYEFFTKKLSLDFSSFNEPPAEIADVVSFLSTHKTLLIPYRHGETGVPSHRGSVAYCDGTEDYNQIAQYSGNFIRDSYKTNFLLNESFESAYLKNASWNDFQGKTTSVAEDLDRGATLLVHKAQLDPQSLEMLETILQAEKTEFEHYTLYRTKQW